MSRPQMFFSLIGFAAFLIPFQASGEQPPMRCAACQAAAAKAAQAKATDAESDVQTVAQQGQARGQGRGQGQGQGQGRGQGQGQGRGRGMGRGGPGFRGGRGAADAQFQEDHEVFFFLLANGKKIRRQVTNIENGVQTVTESDDPDVAAKIQEHVSAMYDRVERGNPIHMRDPLFAEVFRNVDKIKMVSEPTDKGVKVTETSEDPYVAKLIQAHAKVVDAFIKNGHTELHRNHAVPKR